MLDAIQIDREDQGLKPMFVLLFATIKSAAGNFRGAPPKELLAAVQSLKDGDKSALSTIVDLTQSRLYAFCFHLTRSPTAAEELAQDTFLRALGRIKELEKPERIFSWLFRVAKNLYIDQHRSAEGKLIKLQDTGDEETGDLLASIPDENRVAADTLHAVRETLGRLEPEERAILLLVDYEEYSYEEAAEAMGLTVPALKFRLGKARRAFVAAYYGEKEAG